MLLKGEREDLKYGSIHDISHTMVVSFASIAGEGMFIPFLTECLQQ
jgi:hypothetical protein